MPYRQAVLGDGQTEIGAAKRPEVKLAMFSASPWIQTRITPPPVSPSLGPG